MKAEIKGDTLYITPYSHTEAYAMAIWMRSNSVDMATNCVPIPQAIPREVVVVLEPEPQHTDF